VKKGLVAILFCALSADDALAQPAPTGPAECGPEEAPSSSQASAGCDAPAGTSGKSGGADATKKGDDAKSGRKSPTDEKPTSPKAGDARGDAKPSGSQKPGDKRAAEGPKREGGAETGKGAKDTSDDARRIGRGTSAVMDVASALDRALPPFEGRVLLGVAPLAADVAAPRGKALAVTLAQVFGGKRKIEPPSEAEPLEAVRGRAQGVREIVYLSPRIVNGELTVTADVFPVPRTVWARIRNPAPGPVAHAFAKAFIDAEVRAHLEPLPMTAFEATRGKNFESGVLALACDDLDRDGAPEILSMSRRSITLSRIREGRVHPVASRTWADLSSVAPAPLREPIGFVLTERVGDDPLGARGVVASLTDRANAVELDSRLDPAGSFAAMAVPDGDAFSCARLQAVTVTGPLVSCRRGAASPTRASVGGRYDAFASASLVGADGKPFTVSAGREDGTLEVFDDAGHKVTGPRVGAQIAVGDIDEDGAPEIFSSLDVPRGGVDALVVHSWSRGEQKLREIARMPVAAGVQAIAVCPPESARRAAFLVATPDEIVVMR
jgi:hypothetical protein